jgi:hypothetical protein
MRTSEVRDRKLARAALYSRTPDSRPSQPPLVTTPHPLAGTYQTATRGEWAIAVVEDNSDGRTRQFRLVLTPANAREGDSRPFVIRVPLTVIDVERSKTWATDLREELTYWITSNVIERGEIVWWPSPPAQET